MIVKAGANGKEQYQIRQPQKNQILPPHVFIFIIKLLKQKCSFLLNQGILKLQLNLLRY
jgi:hypothetical protein